MTFFVNKHGDIVQRYCKRGHDKKLPAATYRIEHRPGIFSNRCAECTRDFDRKRKGR